MKEFRPCGMHTFNSTGIHRCAAEATHHVTYVEQLSAEEGGGAYTLAMDTCDRHNEVVARNYTILSDVELSHDEPEPEPHSHFDAEAWVRVRRSIREDAREDVTIRPTEWRGDW